MATTNLEYFQILVFELKINLLGTFAFNFLWYYLVKKGRTGMNNEAQFLEGKSRVLPVFETSVGV
jgi:hypothetical protein